MERGRSVVCLHATDPATVYLSVWARMDDMTVADLDGALYDDRSIVKHLAMRRTLFAFPREACRSRRLGASNRVADAQRRRLVKEVERRASTATATAGCLVPATRSSPHWPVVGKPARPSSARRSASLEGAMTYGEGRSWGGRVSVGPRC